MENDSVILRNVLAVITSALAGAAMAGYRLRGLEEKLKNSIKDNKELSEKVANGENQLKTELANLKSEYIEKCKNQQAQILISIKNLILEERELQKERDNALGLDIALIKQSNTYTNQRLNELMAKFK
jgi:hypothetical protein